MSMPTPAPQYQEPPAFGVEDDWEETPIRPRRRSSWLTRSLALAAVAALAFGAGAYAHERWGSSGGDSAGTGFPAGALAAPQRARSTGGSGAGTAQPTIGEVKYIKGNVLYVETTDGATVKVRVAQSVQVSKTETTDVSGIDAGDQVVVMGTKGASGIVTASRISVGGLTGLFGSPGGGQVPGGAFLPGGATGTGNPRSGQAPAGGGAGFQPGG
jgi:hypothetical protein